MIRQCGVVPAQITIFGERQSVTEHAAFAAYWFGEKIYSIHFLDDLASIERLFLHFDQYVVSIRYRNNPPVCIAATGQRSSENRDNDPNQKPGHWYTGNKNGDVGKCCRDAADYCQPAEYLFNILSLPDWERGEDVAAHFSLVVMYGNFKQLFRLSSQSVRYPIGQLVHLAPATHLQY